MRRRCARQFRWIEKLWARLETLGGVRRNGDPVRAAAQYAQRQFPGPARRGPAHRRSTSPGLRSRAARPAWSARCSRRMCSRRMGVPADWAAATVRFSIGAQIRDEDLAEIARRVRRGREASARAARLDTRRMRHSMSTGAPHEQARKTAHRHRRRGRHRPAAASARAAGAAQRAGRRGLQLAARRRRRRRARISHPRRDRRLGRDARPARPRHHLDRHAAGAARAHHHLGAGGGQARFLPGAHGHEPARGPRDARRRAGPPATRHHALPAAARHEGRAFFQKLLRDGYVGELWHFRLMALRRPVFRSARAAPLAPAHRTERHQRPHRRHLRRGASSAGSARRAACTRR